MAFSSDGSLRTITLARPEKRNALSHDMFGALIEEFRRPADPRERVRLLRAEGPVFCAGVDLGQRSEGPVVEGESLLEQLCTAVWECPLPVVAVVTGHAIGGGFMLVSHCDFVISTDTAKLGNSAVQLGLVPPWRLSRQVGRSGRVPLARQLLLLGDLQPAAELRRILTVCSPDDIEREVERLVEQLRKNAPLSLRAIKATLNADAFERETHEYATALIQEAQASADSKEGVLARRERREPTFYGR